MADFSTNNELAQALSEAKAKAREGVLKGSDLERSTRERLQNAGCLSDIIKGWYLLNKPGAAGSSTAWFGGFWAFLSYYLTDRFGEKEYCLSAESSTDLHTRDGKISKQIVVVTQQASNQTVKLPHQTSILLYTDSKNFPKQIERIHNVNVMPLSAALCRLSSTYFKNCSLNAEIALKLLPSASEVSRVLLEERSIAAAGRLVGAYRHIADEQKAEQIANDMAAAGLTVVAENPFDAQSPLLPPARLQSAHAGRIEAMWTTMREVILETFPQPPGRPKDSGKVIRIVQERYTKDAYHSLSIEGYQVTEELIKKIASSEWDPKIDEADKNQRDALAAKGYEKAFKTVLDSLLKALKGENPGKVFSRDLQSWYRDLFTPVVQAGLLKASDLAGYRNGPVYIEGSRHIPPDSASVLDTMEMLFELLNNEPHAGVSAVLGHFIFVYIHPYSDGNGRIGRFILNLMLASGGYPWTVIRTSERARYMSALESASVAGDILPFAKFVKSEMEYWENSST